MNRYPELSFQDIVRKGSDILDLSVPAFSFDQFQIYFEMLRIWNGKQNLTSLIDPFDIAVLHFLDSLTLIKLMPPACSRVLDVGSGAGFPGLVLKIAMPQLHIDLLDRNSKKLVFLKNVAHRLGMSQVTFIDNNVADFLKSYDISFFDVIVTRALLLPDSIMELIARKMNAHASFIRMTGPASFGSHVFSGFFFPRAVWSGYLPFLSVYRKLISYSPNISPH
jgi:16S rRNA (guanine527-N7)-methyltransferase